MSARGSPYRSHQWHRGRKAGSSNPLRRTSDKIETWFVRFLMLVLFVGLPAASLSAGLTAYDTSMRTVHAQSAERQHVTARLTSKVAPSAGSSEEVWQQARVRWTDTNGTTRTGSTLVHPGTPLGATVRIWVDRDGTVGAPPMTRSQAMTSGWLAAGLTATTLASGVCVARAGIRAVLDRHRYARWDAEWELVEPHWSARFRG